VLRIALLGSSVLAVAYATLPWWLPKGLLAEAIANALARQTGVEVSIRRLDASWSGGISCEGITIKSPEGFDGEDMVRLATLRCDFSPLSLMFSGRLQWAELIGAELNVIVAPDGQVNLAALGPLLDKPPPRRVMVRRAAVTVRLPSHEQALRLDVTHLQYQAGRLKDLGRISMSAVLPQPGGGAPITLMSSVGGPSGPGGAGDGAVAACGFRFAGVDLAELHLPRLLGLPLKHLAGRASGQLGFRVRRSLKVDRFSFSLRVEGLDARPMRGRPLPVIDHAEVSLAAEYDPLEGVVEAERFRLRLPGVDLTGSGQVHTSVAAGAWEGVRRLNASGTINPATVAALLSGGAAPLPGGIAFDGQVRLNVSVQADASRVSSTVVLDATAAAVRTPQRVLKPADRTLAVEFRGSVEKQTWRLAADQADLRIGGNVFTGGGAMRNIRRALTGWLDAGKMITSERILNDLAALDWQGSWTIVELDSLRDLLGGDALRGVRLDGRMVGDWSIRHAGATEVSFTTRLPAGTRFDIGSWFVKPPDKPARVHVTCEIPAKAPRRIWLQVRGDVGDAGFSIHDGTLSLSAWDPADEVVLQAAGRFSVRDAEHLIACCPAARGWPCRLAGAATGTFDACLAPSVGRVHVAVNGTRLAVAVGEAFSKPAGEPADVTADLLTDRSAPATARHRLAARLRLGAATAEGAVTIPSPEAPEAPLRFTGQVRVADAASVLERFPALAQTLAEGRIAGSMVVRARGRIGEGLADGEIILDADDLAFRVGEAVKPRGAALRLRLAGAADTKQLRIHTLAVDLGRSSVRADGRVNLAKTFKMPPAGTVWPAPGVAGVDLNLNAHVVLDAAMRSLAPAWAGQARQWGIQGGVRIEGRLRGDGEGIQLAADVDARELVVVGPGAFRKAAGTPARCTLDLAVAPDLSKAQVGDLFVDAFGCQVRADAKVAWGKAIEATAHVAINVPDLSRLARHVPQLGAYRLAGGLFVEASVARTGGRDLIEYATIVPRGAKAVVRGMACGLDGSATVQRVALRDFDPATLTVGRFKTRSLEFAAGRTHGFLVADVRRPLAAPAGAVRLLCPVVDAHELTTWAAPGALPSNADPLTPADKAQLARRADDLIAAVKKRLAGSDIRCRAFIGRLRHFDPNVRAFYEVRAMVADVRADDRRIDIAYRCGLNGGGMNQGYTVDLTAPEPKVGVRADLTDVQTKQNMLVQLARDFPGNTVYGTLTRRERVTYQLRDLLANALDPRHRPIRVGIARTVTVDGMVEGRAAPRFVTKFFPGLNLAKYRYRRMTVFTDLTEDGSAHNDMIFVGPEYDLYMQGVTDVDQIASYTIGLILPRLLKSPESNHRLRQGRVPILKFKARIVDGRFKDESVSYLLPTEAAYIMFVRNNIVYRLLLTPGRKPGPAQVVKQPASAPSGGSGPK